MKYYLFLVILCHLACQDRSPGEDIVSNPTVNTPTTANHPSKIVGTYILESASLNGPKFEVIVSSDPKSSVVYLPNADITHLVRQIVFRGGGEVSYQSMCNESQQAIEFKSNGKTSHVCIANNSNTLEMGFWNTTGSQDDLLAWSIIHDREVIACEISPYEVSPEMLVGYMAFPLPRNTAVPFLEGDNHQYRKIKIMLRKL